MGILSLGGLAKQSTLLQVQQQLVALAEQVNRVVTQDATIAAIAADISADETKQAAALSAIQGIVSSLQAEVAAGGASPATLAALQAAEAAEDAFTTSIQSAQTTDTPPAATPPASLWLTRSRRQPRLSPLSRMLSASSMRSLNGWQRSKGRCSVERISHESVGNRSHHRRSADDRDRFPRQPAQCPQRY